ncbi:MAG: replicative DNA helicase, partial [Candidatus Aegiribacteria sp.]|nr:replicative DNA helicase [Candidatus Aegiribacteria sp.]
MTEEKGYRPPHSLDAEKSVLGAMLLDQELTVEALDALNTKDFFDRKHRMIFQACRDLDSRNSVTDMVTVGEELSRKKTLEEAGGIEYISSLTDDIPLLSNVLQYIKIIKDKAMLRQLIKVSRENINEVLEGTGDVENVLDTAAS